MANKAHPQHKFGTGNLNTLCNRCVSPQKNIHNHIYVHNMRTPTLSRVYKRETRQRHSRRLWTRNMWVLACHWSERNADATLFCFFVLGFSARQCGVCCEVSNVTRGDGMCVCSSRTGTKETHCHKTREALMALWTEHYTAPRMRLNDLSHQMSRTDLGVVILNRHANPLGLT
eukprot:192067-Rhodomonas_salina.1